MSVLESIQRAVCIASGNCRHESNDNEVHIHNDEAKKDMSHHVNEESVSFEIV